MNAECVNRNEEGGRCSSGSTWKFSSDFFYFLRETRRITRLPEVLGEWKEERH